MAGGSSPQARLQNPGCVLYCIHCSHALVDEFFRTAVVFGGIYTLLLGIGAAVRPGWHLNNRIVAAQSLAISFLHLWLHFLIRGIVLQPPVANQLYVPVLWLLGPGTYLVFMATVIPGYKMTASRWLFLPAVLVLIGLLAAGAGRPELVLGNPADYFRGGRPGAPEILVYAAFLWNSLVYSGVYWRLFSFFRLSSLARERGARVMLGILIGTAVIHTYFAAAYLLRQIDLILWGAIALTVFSAAAHLATQHVPALFFRLAPEVREAYQKTRLQRVDVDAMEKQLELLMSQEKLYRDEDLTLGRVAELLGTSSHVLSELINSKRKMNFSRFVNTYRVEEAARILAAQRDANILSVAFLVGFNSKANFNLAFKSILGTTPRQYISNSRPG